MTIRELIDLLEEYDDDQYVYVNLHSESFPRGSQLFIQGIEPRKPWYGDGPALIGIVADAGNRAITKRRAEPKTRFEMFMAGELPSAIIEEEA